MGGLSAYDIYTKFKAGSGSSVSESGRAAQDLVHKHAELESRVSGLIQKMEGAWQGDAAGAAQSGAAPLARVLLQSQTELATANSAFSQQSSLFSGAQSGVVPVDKNAPKSNFLNNVTPWHTDLDKKIDKYKADANTNTRIYNNYSKSSGDLANTMPASYTSVNSDSPNVGVVEPNQTGPGSGGWGGAPGARGGSGGGSWGGSVGWRGPVAHAGGGPIPGSGAGGPGGWQGPGGNPGGWTGGAFPGPPAATTTQGAGDIPSAGKSPQGGWGSGGSAGSGSGSGGSAYGGGFVPGAGPGGSGGGGGSGRVGGGSARSGAGSGGSADRRLGAGGSMGSGEEPGGGRTVGGRAGAVGGRGAAGQSGMGMGGAGRGGRGEEDGEHHAASYLVDDRADEIVGELPRTAPPVIGE